MTSYHYSPVTGRREVCRAKGTCKYASVSRFTNPENVFSTVEKETVMRTEIASLVPRNNPEWSAYYAATDVKHFGDKSQPGSKFLSKELNRIEDVLELAYRQRGHLNGDDKDKFIAKGSTVDAFYEGNRYLYVKTEGTMGVINSTELENTQMLDVVRTKPGAPCSLVVAVANQPRTNYGVIIIATDEESGKEVFITAFPGLVTKSPNKEEIDSLEGQQLTVESVRDLLGADFWVNTRVVD